MRKIFLTFLLSFLIYPLYSENYYLICHDFRNNSSVDIGEKGLRNKKIAISSLYKVFLSYYFLKERIIDGNTKFNCTLSRDCNCWDKRGHGILNVVGAISFSCNRFFCHFRKRIDPFKYYSFLNNLFDLPPFVRNDFCSFYLEGNFSPIYGLKPEEILMMLTSFLLNRDLSSGKSLELNGGYLSLVKLGMKSCYECGTGKRAYEILKVKDVFLKTGTYRKKAKIGILYRNLSFAIFNGGNGYISILVYSLKGNSMNNSVVILAKFLKDYLNRRNKSF